jgi:ribosomal protein S18 acetylase RimI-like enzyme
MPDSYVGVALDEGTPVGVISGTLHRPDLKTAILGALDTRSWLRIGLILALHPSLFGCLIREMKPQAPIKSNHKEIYASLTTIAVATSHRRKGIATRLVEALEFFFRKHHITNYWLDTTTENTSARIFYRKLGFIEIKQHNQTVILLKHLPTIANTVSKLD